MAKGWTPLKLANAFRPLTDDEVRRAAAIMDEPEDTTRAKLQAEADGSEYWINDLYQVQKRPLCNDAGEVKAYHLNIRRRDGRPIFRDWRHFQRIKNELVGEECEGFEMYPAESRMVDASNKYHVFVFTDPTYRIPFGMDKRDVLDDTGERKPGYRQRKL